MKRTDTSDWPCPIARAAAVLGDHWNLLLIRQACLGTRRFEDFQAVLGISRNILSTRLATLVAEGLFSRVQYQPRPARFEYRLTDKGRDLYPILVAMADWGERWTTAPEGVWLRFEHTSCGNRSVRPVVACSECGEPLTMHNTRASYGRGAEVTAVRRE